MLQYIDVSRSRTEVSVCGDGIPVSREYTDRRDSTLYCATGTSNNIEGAAHPLGTTSLTQLPAGPGHRPSRAAGSHVTITRPRRVS